MAWKVEIKGLENLGEIPSVVRCPMCKGRVFREGMKCANCGGSGYALQRTSEVSAKSDDSAPNLSLRCSKGVRK